MTLKKNQEKLSINCELMKKFKVDKNTIWEDTGRIVVHNYPPNKGTESYIARIYKEYKKGASNYKLIEGSFVSFSKLSLEQESLAIIVGEAQRSLSHSLDREYFLKPIIK